ncbi:hypothetical protein ACFQU7_31485 [Pseudoroseomonas wenyumeiae]
MQTIGAQITETIRLHRPMTRRAAEDEAARLLDLVGIPRRGSGSRPIRTIFQAACASAR